PQSRIVVLSTGDPGLAYPILRQAQLERGGAMIGVSDEESFDAMRRLARTQGISVEPATAVAFAGLKKLVQDGTIQPRETVVVNCSGHTFPVEKHIMDDQIVLDMKLTAQAKTEADGLAGALEHLEEQITTLVIIDDNPLDRVLVKRVLQDNKPYRLFEADNGPAGLELAEARRPDLIILDLNMPDMDGFTVLDRLKQNPVTAAIPVVVVSAKELSPDEKKRLEGKTASIWQKGAFSTGALMSHLVKTVQTVARPQSNDVINALNNIDHNTYKIVIIDDNPDDIRLLKRILESRQKYDIYDAQNGQEGLAVIKAQNPDLIILDLTMPDMDGFAVMEAIKADPDTRTTPIIVVSGKELSPAQREQLDTGTTSVMQKGKITLESLVSQVDRKLN
ncbi:MAG: pyridoxal-phosphate dependent enzyme, partial [Anaerolineae bacterium]